MIVETLVVASLVLSGSLALRAAGLRGWVLAPAGLLVGMGFYVAIMLILVVPQVSTSPVIALSATMVIGVGWWVVWWRRGRDVAINPWAAGVVSVGIVAFVATVRTLRLVGWHGDSVFYILYGRALYAGTYHEAMANVYYQKRALGVPAIHAPAGLHGESYLVAITPLIAIAVLALIAWFAMRGTSGRVPRGYAIAFIVVGIAFLVTSNRVVYHAWYLNGHLMAGAMVLMAAGSGWLMVRRRGPAPALVTMIVAASVATTVTRAEGSLMMAIVIVPVVCAPHISQVQRRVVMAGLGIPMAVWSGYGVSVSVTGAEPLALSTVALFVVGLALCGAQFGIGTPWWERHSHHLVWLAEVGLWSVLVALVARDSQILSDSVRATIVNVMGAGKWGVTILAAITAVTVVVATLRVAKGAALRLPITTFIPLVLIVAYLRDAAYRVGLYDSLNRMWMQILPLAVLFIVVALAEAQWRPWVRRAMAGSGLQRQRIARG